MEGAVKRIQLDNFVTYDSVECRPSENLNVIIGPNGTGKSTIVSAIMLGLGEKPQLTGRGKKAQEFIKTGKDEARILLELHPDHKIERRITADGKSVYKLNSKTVSEKEINNFTKNLNIQVGNLCQFLPQDRVSEFARMNKKELLMNTEKAVGGDELVKLHNDLIEMQSRSLNEGNDLALMETSLANKREQNARLDVDITTITEKNNLLMEIANCKKKLLWVQYHDAKTATEEEQKKLLPKEKEVNEAKAALKPVEREIYGLEKKLQEMKEKRKRTRKSYDDFETMMKRNLEEVQDAFAKRKHLEKNDKMNAANDEKRVKEIEGLRQSLEDQGRSILEKEAAVDEKKRQLLTINSELNEFAKQIAYLDQQITEVKKSANQFKYEKEALRNRIASVENVRAKKLELLRQRSPDAYNGVKWLEDNRHLFKGRVYLPTMVELNVTDPRFVNYVEAAIGYRDLVAFSCERKDDTNLLTNELRAKRGMKINVLCTDTDRPVPPPPLSREQIRRLGFDGYVDDFISCPDSILKYLKLSSSLHRVPVSHRRISSDNLPSSIMRYYADGVSVSMSKSRYAEGTTTMFSDVKQAHCLRSQNVANADEEKSRLRVVEESLAEHSAQVDELTRQKAKILEASAQKRHEKNILGQHTTDLATAKLAHGRKKQQLQDLERERQEFLSERGNLQQKIEDLIKAAVKKHVSCAALYENARKVNTELKKGKIEEFWAKQNLKIVDKKLKTRKAAVDLAENEFARVRIQHQRLRDHAKRTLDEAKKGTDNCGPRDEGFRKYSKIFETFPASADGLEGLISEKQALVACKKDVDNSIVEDYQKRAREIEQLEKDIRKKEADIVNSKTKMTRVKEDWLRQLRTLVSKISTNFRKYYREIQCAGDVVLEPGSEEHDYKNYGLSVQVSYRESEPLKELDQFTQSGGERAVATALYMFSLQELTKVPFRCVDEINQGMDEINERRVYKLLMTITSYENSSQYFLLTPKLLKGIEYSDSCMVHCIFNGPHVLPWKDWNIDSIINRKKRSRDAD